MTDYAQLDVNKLAWAIAGSVVALAVGICTFVLVRALPVIKMLAEQFRISVASQTRASDRLESAYKQIDALVEWQKRAETMLGQYDELRRHLADVTNRMHALDSIEAERVARERENTLVQRAAERLALMTQERGEQLVQPIHPTTISGQVMDGAYRHNTPGERLAATPPYPRRQGTQTIPLPTRPIPRGEK